MLSTKLTEAVKQLDEAEKLELVQLLINDLKLVGAVYEVFTPFVLATNSQLTGSSPVDLAVAWTSRPDCPVTFGQTNLLMESNVCFYRSQGFFDVWRT